MTSILVLRVLELNEKLDRLVLFWCKRRLTWNIDQQRWSLEKDNRKLLAFNIILYGLLGIFSLGLGILLALINQFFFRFLSYKVVTVWLFICLFASFAFQFDALLYWFGEEALPAINYLIHRERSLSGKPITKLDIHEVSIKIGTLV